MVKLKTMTKFYLSAAILMLVFLVYDHVYAYIFPDVGYFTLEDYAKNPQAYDGLKEERFGRIINISDGYFYFNSGGKPIKVFGSGLEMPVFGETAIYVELEGDGRIKLVGHHNYNYNYLLYLISAVALLVFLVIFFKEWRITKRGFENA